MVDVACNTEQKVKITASPKTASGKPAALDGPLRISVTAGDGTFTQDPAEPNAFYVVSGDGPGETRYRVEGDADLGTDEKLISDEVVLTVTGVQAESFGLTVGSPEPK